MNAVERHTIKDMLDALNLHEVRATYGAVAEGVFGDRRTAQSVSGLLGQRRPCASWVVNAHTKEPTGYLDDLNHPAPHVSARAHRVCRDGTPQRDVAL